MPARILTRPELLMSMKDIAELADKPRPLITTWRRRYPDSFPSQASGDETHPQFDPYEVADWLLTTGRIERDRAEQELALFMLTGLAASYPRRDAVAAVTALICLRYLALAFHGGSAAERRA